MIFDVLRGDAEVIDRLSDEWSQLCSTGPCDEPFYRPEWVGAHVRAFAPRQRVTLVTTHDGACLTSVLPLVHEVGFVRGIPARRFRGAANVHSGRFDLIRGTATREMNTVWRRLRRLREWDVLELADVPADGGAVSLARVAAHDGYQVQIFESMRSPGIPLAAAGGSFDAVLARTNAKFRANLRRRMRRLQSVGTVRLQRFDHAEPGLVQRFYALERAGWKGQQGTAIACHRRTRQFYDEAIAAASKRGYLAMYSLECGDRVVAMQLGLAHHGRYFLLKTAYDESFSQYSPGQLIVHEVLRDLVTRHFSEFDFLGPEMEWKQEWSPEIRPHVTCYVFNQGRAGRFVHSAAFRLRPALGRTLRGLRNLRWPRPRRLCV